MPYFLLCLFLAFPARADWLEHWEKIPASALPARVPDGDLAAFRTALTRQIENCAGTRAKKTLVCGEEGAGARLACDDAALAELAKIAKKERTWKAFYAKTRNAFDWYRYRAPKEGVLFTGYNSPLFEASLTKTEKYAYPLYGKPGDLVTVKDEKNETVTRRRLPDGKIGRFFDRKAIETDHALAGRHLEIAWLASPVDVVRLQIEGSGILRLHEKEKTREVGVNYAGKSGHPYVSIFKILKARDVDAKYLTFPGLHEYWRDHPQEFRAALDESPSYVFFSIANEPPCGAARVHVTGGHSLAVDPTRVMLGSALLMEAERPKAGTSPDAKVVPTQPFTRFGFAQDTGGAIKGAHVDVYWGTGEYAMLASNSMQAHGNLFLLRAKEKGAEPFTNRSPSVLMKWAVFPLENWPEVCAAQRPDGLYLR